MPAAACNVGEVSDDDCTCSAAANGVRGPLAAKLTRARIGRPATSRTIATLPLAATAPSFKSRISATRRSTSFPLHCRRTAARRHDDSRERRRKPLDVCLGCEQRRHAPRTHPERSGTSRGRRPAGEVANHQERHRHLHVPSDGDNRALHTEVRMGSRRWQKGSARTSLTRTNSRRVHHHADRQQRELFPVQPQVRTSKVVALEIDHFTQATTPQTAPERSSVSANKSICSLRRRCQSYGASTAARSPCPMRTSCSPRMTSPGRRGDHRGATAARSGRCAHLQRDCAEPGHGDAQGLLLTFPRGRWVRARSRAHPASKGRFVLQHRARRGSQPATNVAGYFLAFPGPSWTRQASPIVRSRA